MKDPNNDLALISRQSLLVLLSTVVQRTVFTAGPPFGSSCHPANLIVTLLTFVIRNAPGGNSLQIVFVKPL